MCFRVKRMGCLAAGLLWAAAAFAQLAGPAPEGAAEPDAIRSEVERFRTELIEPDRAFSPAARREALQRWRTLADRASQLPPLSVAMELAQIAALADNGHTLVSYNMRSQGSNRVPLRLVPFGRDYFVVHAAAPHADLLGARLLAVDGVDIERLREAGHSLVGGTPAWRDRALPALVESPAQLNALGLVGDAHRARYRFAAGDGRETETVLVAEAPSQPAQPGWSSRWLPAAPTALRPGWRSLISEATAPWALREAGQPFRWRHDPALKLMVIELRQTHDSESQRLRDFLSDVEGHINRLQPQHLVLDLRLNGGGDLTRARDFARALPARVGGRTFVLTSPWTFSAAISTLGYVKQAAPERVTIVGEAVGDRLEFFAEGRAVELRRLGQWILPATERHDYRHGCRGHADCHLQVVRFPIAVASLAPEISAPWTIEAYRAGIDPAMAAVEQALKQP